MKTSFFTKQLMSRLCLLLGIIASVNSVAAQQEQAYMTAKRYDLAGKLTGTISPDPDGAGTLRLLATRNIYNPTTGLLDKVESGELANWSDENTLANDWTGFTIFSTQVITYDDYARKATVTIKDKNGAVLSLTEYSYDNNSRVLCTALRMNLAATGNACSSVNLSGANPDRISRFTYDDYDQVTKEERAVDTSVQQNYVINTYQGRILRSQVDANGNRTDLYYDTANRLKRIVYPSPTSTGSANGSETGTTGDYVEFQYDSSGSKTYERKRNNTSITYTLDNNKRVIFKDYSNTQQKDITYDYDLRGLQLSAKFGTVGITNTFDGFGNLASSSNDMSNTLKVGYVYDLNDNRTRVDHPDGAKFSYEFDGLNRVKRLRDGVNTELLNVSYQPNGRRDKISRYNGTTTEYKFDNGVQLYSFSQKFKTPVNDLTNTFLYNNASQITDLTLGNSLYYYQGNDNRTGDYVTNGLNQYKKIGTVLQDYDSNGNLLYDGLTYYSYDDENHLLTITKKDDGSFGANFVYDPNGRLFQTTINGKITKYLYAGDALIAEYDGSTGELERRYVHGDQVDEPWVQYNGRTVPLSNGTIDPITLPAASATFVGSHVLATSQTGYTGATGFIDFVGEGEAKWTFTTTTTSTYNITARYSSVGSDRPLAVMIDGVQKAVLSFPDTVTWNTWSTAQVSIPITAGSHTLSLKTKGSSGPNVDYVTVNAQSGTGIYFLHSDHQGSVIAQSDSTGKVTTALAYDSYGIPAKGNIDRFGYTGQIWFKDLGLDYYKARMYSPTLGRFLQTDPIGYKDDMDLYAYVGNDPLNRMDPTGESCQSLQTGVGYTCTYIESGHVATKTIPVTVAGAPNLRAIGIAAIAGVKTFLTSRAARREAMRDQKIPTSQQPRSQSRNESGREQTYEVPKEGGSKELKSVQQQTKDSSHPDTPHWEAGKVKTDPVTGETRMTNYDRPKLTNDKSKVEYED